MTRLIRWLTNQYTRLWLRWHWARGRRQMTSDDYVHTMLEVNAADDTISALDKKPFVMQFICANCGAIALAECDSLDSGTTLKCDECGKDRVIVLMTNDEHYRQLSSPYFRYFLLWQKAVAACNFALEDYERVRESTGYNCLSYESRDRLRQVVETK